MSFGIVIVVELIKGVVLEQLYIVKVQGVVFGKMNIVELIIGVVLEQLYIVKSQLESSLGIIVQSPEINFGKTEWLYFQGSPYL